MSQEEQSLEAAIQRDMAEISWIELKNRCPVDAIVHVANTLDLLEVAKAVAKDESDKVSAWMAAGSIRKLDESDVAVWDEQPVRFLGAFITPFVLLQQIPNRSQQSYFFERA